MTVFSVVVDEADNEYAPPPKEIELSVIGGDLNIYVFKGSRDDLKGKRKELWHVVIRAEDMVAALRAYNLV